MEYSGWRNYPSFREHGNVKTILNGLKALENEVQAKSGKKMDMSFAKIMLAEIAYCKLATG
ncbi:hypothetical protein Elgi_17460 [Paenibacillus elgii]|nr:hypothetical protein Elgi_17460 [Paenibacillus elgii]